MKNEYSLRFAIHKIDINIFHCKFRLSSRLFSTFREKGLSFINFTLFTSSQLQFNCSAHTHTETKHRPNCNSKIDNANLVKKCAKHIDCLSNIYLWFHSRSQSLCSFFPPRQHSHSSRQASRQLPLWREGKCNA